MGTCASKQPPKPNPYAPRDAPEYSEPPNTTPNPTTPRRRPFPPPSPAKHLKAVILRRYGGVKPSGGAAIREEEEEEGLDKSFGLAKKFDSSFEVGEEVGRGHFGYTCSAVAKKGELKGRKVAVKIIPKSKMTTAVAVEDVRREIKILHALTGHPNLVQFYDAFEDADNVYIAMELCEGGELLDRILARGGKFSEDHAKDVIVQILNVVAFCHLQGVVHRDIKPENFLFTSKDENSELKAIDFGLSDYIKPDQKLNEIVGSAYYVAPEVLHRSYSTEADIWSIGVITYILLCGSRPFWARTESGIFQAVLKTSPNFDENPWPSLSPESKDFVSHLLQKDPNQRLTAAQALCHRWVRNHNKVKLQLDALVFRLMKAYMRSSSLRKAALRALSKTLTPDELFYLKEQFALFCPDESGGITLHNMRMALLKNVTDAMKESRVFRFLDPLSALQYRRMYFEEFCAAALSVHQMEVLDSWEERTRCAYEMFEEDGNKVIVIEEVASELGLSASVPVHTVLQEWIKHSDGKLTCLGFVKLLLNQSFARTL
ncbi:Ca2+/calmodulin-dependent protein kinase, EF-Hand protein superfamily [Handroanthus impetiginosus]|uniref:non-specific serine/threonine protein kinase n=1 Tax=Handroanthus impetiginosus TaxID=429701 RepID=A0A2G9HSF6_9LAMI|nr:Ca2+/calmodulin-dependent protein kinase, EF-Hand protein superfamily [Handroanthus impetiginosus]